MTPGFLRIGKQTRGFDNDIDAERLPRQRGRALLHSETLDLVSVDHQHIVLGDAGAGFFTGDRAVEAALSRIVSDQVCQIVCRYDVVYRNDIDLLAEQALVAQRAKNQPADPSKPVNSDFDCHLYFLLNASG